MRRADLTGGEVLRAWGGVLIRVRQQQSSQQNQAMARRTARERGPARGSTRRWDDAGAAAMELGEAAETSRSGCVAVFSSGVARPMELEEATHVHVQ